MLDILAEFCYHGTMIMNKEIEMNGDYEYKEILFEMGLLEAIKQKLPNQQHFEFAHNYVAKKINGLI